MGRHRIKNSPLDVALGLYARFMVALDNAITGTFTRRSGTFRCEHCSAECTVTNVSSRELRAARKLATDHSRHRPGRDEVALFAS